MKRGRSIVDPESPYVHFTPLGSGQEVGRSCHLLQYKGKNVLLDCGLHPGKKGMDALPFFDAENAINPSDIDLLLITHFHVDHVAALPYFTEKTKFRGQIYMTRPTRVVSELLLMDYVRVVGNNSTDGSQLFNAQDVVNCMKKVSLLDYHQEINVGGIRFTAYNAGHVLGAAMFLIEIADVRILYTGDFSREEDRHLMSAEIPQVQPDLLICESTFGTMLHETREKKEEDFTSTIVDIIKRGGRCLIPVFSLGRAQELLLILEDYWKRHPWLHKVRIYHNSKVATKALEVYRTYINVMNEAIRIENRQSNPWQFDFISPLYGSIDTNEPMVIMASPGMLQNGKSRELFEQMCTDEKNGVIISGYSVEGTLANTIDPDMIVSTHRLIPEYCFMTHGTGNVKQIQALDGHLLNLKCEIKTISFAAHTDFKGTKSFIEDLRPRNIVLVHGNKTQMGGMKKALEEQLANTQGLSEMKIYMPPNTQVVKFEMFEERIIKAMGELAAKKSCPDGDFLLYSGTRLAGLLVRHDFQERMVAPIDLNMYTQLSTAVVLQQLHLPFHSSFERLVAVVGKLFEVSAIEVLSVNTPVGEKKTRSKKKKLPNIKKNKMKVYNTVSLTHTEPPGRVLMEWESSPSNDMIADAVTALVMQAEGSIDGIRLSGCCSTKHNHGNVKVKQEQDMSKSAEKVGTPGDDQDAAVFENNSGFLILSFLVEETFGKDAVKHECDNEKRQLRISQSSNDATCIVTMSSSGEITNVECDRDSKLLAKVNELVRRVSQVTCPLISGMESK